MKYLKQYRNLIMVVLGVILVICVIAADPLGIIVKRQQERAQIRNQIAIEEAETAKQIALIQAEQEAELIRIHQGIVSVSAADIEEAQTESLSGDAQ